MHEWHLPNRHSSEIKRQRTMARRLQGRALEVDLQLTGKRHLGI